MHNLKTVFVQLEMKYMCLCVCTGACMHACEYIHAACMHDTCQLRKKNNIYPHRRQQLIRY